MDYCKLERRSLGYLMRLQKNGGFFGHLIRGERRVHLEEWGEQTLYSLHQYSSREIV